MDNPEYQEQPKPKEKVFNHYGLYVLTDVDAYPLLDKKDPALENNKNVVMVSQPDWEQTLDALSQNDFGHTTVITPELITVANKSWEDIVKCDEELQKELDRIVEISRLQKNVTFIIGSPFFEDPEKLPFNAALIFKNGELIDRSDKKLLGPVEGKYFQCNPQAEPIAIGDTTVLVCRDLIGAQQTRLNSENRQPGQFRNGVADFVRFTMGNEDLANQFTNAQFISPNANRLIVEACWGTGITSEYLNNPTQQDIDDFYLMAMKVNANSLLKQDPNLTQIIVCDRAPKAEGDKFVSSKPMNAVFFKS